MSKNRILFILAIVGIAIASYVLQGTLRHTTVVCLTNGCELVQKSPYSRLFGIPVSAYGLVGYSLLTMLSLLWSFHPDKRIYRAMLAIAAGGTGFVLWFSSVQALKIGGFCMWCMLSTVNMITIFLLLGSEFTRTMKKITKNP